MKCKYCKSTHTNGRVYGEIKDICMNCQTYERMLLDCVEALNRTTPLTGKPRKITLVEFTITK